MWGRGLKLAELDADGGSEVAPCVGAWIETVISFVVIATGSRPLCGGVD